MKIILCAAVAAALALPSISSADNYCGEIYTDHYGPFDYRRDKEKLSIVEKAHFKREVERGESEDSSHLGGNLDYTLQAFPNHHKALATLARVAIRDKTLHIPHSRFPVECYFLRAHQFAPDDGIARATYGAYLYGLGRFDKALAVYQEASALEPDNPMINYNLGLTYLKKNDFEHANLHAHKAYDLGYPLSGLKNQLVRAGQWTDKAQ